MSEIFLAPATFGHYSFQAIKLLEEYNYKYGTNSIGRKLLPREIVELAYNVDGIIAGTEAYSEDVINKLLYNIS
jgi:hypothetical protein